MENDDLLSVLKYLLLKIHYLDLRLSALQIALNSRGVLPETTEKIRQQLQDSPESEAERNEIHNLGPLDAAIAKIVQGLESLEE